MTNGVKIEKLKNLAKIRTGITLRQAIKPVDDGNAHVIQIKDLQDDNEINYQQVIKTALKNIKDDQLLRKGDILLRARGDNRNTALFDGEAYNYLAANQFLVISVNQNEVVPAYLQWFLNQRPAQHYLKENSAGTSIPYIQISALGDLEVALPDVKKQQAIAQLQHLMSEENKLYYQMQENRKQMMKAIVSDILKESRI